MVLVHAITAIQKSVDGSFVKSMPSWPWGCPEEHPSNYSHILSL